MNKENMKEKELDLFEKEFQKRSKKQLSEVFMSKVKEKNLIAMFIWSFYFVFGGYRLYLGEKRSGQVMVGIFTGFVTIGFILIGLKQIGVDISLFEIPLAIMYSVFFLNMVFTLYDLTQVKTRIHRYNKKIEQEIKSELNLQSNLV